MLAIHIQQVYWQQSAPRYHGYKYLPSPEKKTPEKKTPEKKMRRRDVDKYRGSRNHWSATRQGSRNCIYCIICCHLSPLYHSRDNGNIRGAHAASACVDRAAFLHQYVSIKSPTNGECWQRIHVGVSYLRLTINDNVYIMERVTKNPPGWGCLSFQEGTCNAMLASFYSKCRLRGYAQCRERVEARSSCGTVGLQRLPDCGDLLGEISHISSTKGLIKCQIIKHCDLSPVVLQEGQCISIIWLSSSHHSSSARL